MKQFLLIALAIAIFSGCAKQNDEPQPPQNRGDGTICFTTTVLTKGASITTETITNFSVFGYKTGEKLWNEVADAALPDLFNNKAVTRRGVGTAENPYTWDYDGDDVNWGEGFLLNFTFFGYSPVATDENGITAPTGDVTNVPIVEFSTPTDVTKQVDLLTAEVYDRKATVGPVQMHFKHALSRIGFKAFSLTPNVKVTKIEVVGVKYKGKLTLNDSWDSAGDTENFTLTYGTPAVVPTGEEGSATDISSSDGYFLLLPQDPRIGGSSKIIFHYTIDDKEVPQKEYVIQENWEKSKSITYTVDLTTNLEEPLDVTEVTITDWAMGTKESGNGDGKANEVKLTYNDGGTAMEGEQVIQNGELSISKRPASPIETWNTKPDGTGDYYGEGDVIIMTKNTILYNVDNTVTIGGMRWLRGNLSGTAGSASGYYAEGNPIKPGMSFKWGDEWVYQSESSTMDGMAGDRTSNASITPKYSSTQGGYDYTELNGGRAPGDPCQKLGENFLTPTIAQYMTLEQIGNKTDIYRDVAGCFFGANAAACTNNTIAPGCIFIPFAGQRSYTDGALSDENTMGYYWASTILPTDEYRARRLLINTSNISAGSNMRGNGLSVRCVSTDVKVGDVHWTTTNLEGVTGGKTGHKMAATPQNLGHLFKWGTLRVFQRESSNGDGMCARNAFDYTYGAPYEPGGGYGSSYDYDRVSGGPADGDPCRMLGKVYRTPTLGEGNKLVNLSKLRGYYKNVQGAFFGAKAAECSNDKIAEGCVFLPVGGYRDVFSGNLGNTSVGYYWLSSAVPSRLQGSTLYVTNDSYTDEEDRGLGLSVRCVRDATIK